MSVFVTNTPLSQMRPLGSEGERSFARVMALIERNLSPRHAAVFADPVPVRDGSGIDWYTNADGEVLPLAQLAPNDADAVRQELAAILSDLRETADRLESEGGKQHRTALALRSAATFPGEDAIFAARTDEGLKPLVVAWGFESHDPVAAQAFSVSTFGPAHPSPTPRPAIAAAAASTPLSSAGDAPPPPLPQSAPAGTAAAAPAAAGRGFAWLLPLLPALASLLMLAAIAALLLPACGLRTPFGTISFGFPGTYGCSSLAASVVAPELAEGRALERELAVLQQDFQRQRLACLIEAAPAPAPAPVLPIAPAPVPVPEDPRFEQRVDRRGEAQITLIWEGPDDLDLWLQCPDQRYINYQSKHGCNGTLDIDQNAGNNISPSPVENITFPSGLAQPGTHRIGVQLYGSKSGQFPVPFQVRIRDGAGSRVLNGQLNRQGEMVLVDEMRN